MTDLNVPNSLLVEGNNSIILTAEGGSSDISLVDYVRLTYAHTLTADADSLFFTAKGQAVNISGFSSNAIRVFNLTNPKVPVEVTGTVSSQPNGFGVTIAGMKATALLAITDANAKHPAAIVAHQPSSLHAGGNGANLVIITNQAFANQIEPLRALRQSQGYKVMVADVEDIYAEFGYGLHDPSAIRDFLLGQYPLVTATAICDARGSASLDPRNYLGIGNLDFVPTKLIDTSNMETASDDWLVDFNGDGAPDMAIGRLPVRTADEATLVVAKIIAYDQAPKANGLLLVSDLNDGLDFAGANSKISAIAPTGLAVSTIVRASDPTAARNELLNLLSQGQQIVNYEGHGSVNLWRAGLLSDNDAATFSNHQPSPLLVTMTCLNGYFQDP